MPKPSFSRNVMIQAWNDFRGGLNLTKHISLLDSTELADMMNLRYIAGPSGINMESRMGLVKVTGTEGVVAGGSPRAIRDISKYVDSSGYVQYMVVTQSKLYASPGGAAPWTFGYAAGSGTLGGTRGRMANFSGKLMIADGATLKYFLGTGTAGTFGTVASTAPTSTMIAVHGGRLLSNHLTYPNRLYYSQLRDPADWTTTDAAGYIIISEFSKLEGLGKFYDLLLLAGSGPQNVMKLSGTQPADFSVNRAIPGAGAVGPDGILVLSNDVLLMDAPGLLSFRSWEKYGDIEQSIRSDKVSTVFKGWVSTSTVTGVVPSDQLILFYPGSGSYILFYDAQFGIWGKWWFELGTGVTPTCFSNIDGVLYVGDSDGHIWYMPQSTGIVYQDNAVDYNQYFKTGAWAFGDPRTKKHGRFLNAQVSGGAGGSYDITIYRDLSTALAEQIDVDMPDALLVGSASPGTVGAATMLVEETSVDFDDHRINMEFNYAQVGIENIDGAGSKVEIQQVLLDAAGLSR